MKHIYILNTNTCLYKILSHFELDLNEEELKEFKQLILL